MTRELLISYSQAFASYLFRNTSIKTADINAIYLFGSVARGDFDNDSDIDIFVDTRQDIKKAIDRSLNLFLGSEENKKFRLMGIENRFQILSGKADEWELKESVESDAIILYSASISPGMRSFFLIHFNPIKNTAKRNKVVRHLFGRSEKYYKGKGLIETLGGEIVDSRAFIIRAENLNKVLRVLSKENAKYTIMKIWK